MGRDTPIQVYLDDENAAWLKEQADSAGQSTSKYCREVILDHIDREQNDRSYMRYGVDQQIELELTKLRDEVLALLSEFQSETGTKLERIQKARTIYAIAVWRLVYSDYPEAEQKTAMKEALEYVGLDPREDPEIQRAFSSYNR